MPLPSSIPIPKISFGKVKERSLMCIISTQARKIRVVELPVLNSCVYWKELDPALKFLIDVENQYLGPDDNWYQVYSENSSIPLSLITQNYLQDGKNDEAEMKAIKNRLFKITSRQTEMEQFKKAKENDAWNKLMWIVSIVFGSLVIVAGIVYFGG
jgi:hypothetical protein